MLTVQERLDLHKAFWNGAPMSHPLISFRLGDYFFSNKFKANLPLLESQTPIAPDMIHVDDFLEDYERMYRECESIGQSAFFTAEPCTGFPWMEAMMGCPVMGAFVAFISHPIYESLDQVIDLSLHRDHPWFLKYIEFLDKLNALSSGRFPLGQPILRGVTDVLGALISQSEMACSLMTDPELTREAFMKIATCLKELVAEQYRRIPPFHGGYAAGFYHLWAPGKLIWYQEDLSALMAPRHFDEFLRETSEFICRDYDYTMVHLHPSSFFHLDGILSLDGLKVVQINKDVGGPSVEQMLPIFRSVLDAGKRLVVWGDLSVEEAGLLVKELPRHSLFLNIIAPDTESAGQLNEVIQSLWRR